MRTPDDIARQHLADIQRIVRDVIGDEVTPRLDKIERKVDETKDASTTAHREILERLERLEAK